MAEFNADLALDFVKRALGIEEPVAVLFDEDAFETFISKHSIPEAKRQDVHYALALGYVAYLREADYHDLDVKALRAELKKVASAAAALRAALAGLSPDARQAINDYSLGVVMSETLPALSAIATTDPVILAHAMFENDAKPSEFGFNAQAKMQEVDDLAKIADGALTYIRANKSGKRPDDRLSALLEVARTVWTVVLDRPFKLDWTDDHVPITDAARFCFDVARAADAKALPKQIQRAARQAFEESALSQLLE